MNNVLEICIGAVFAILCFLPIAAVFRAFVDGTLKRDHPAILTIVPDFIWILCLGILGGIIVRGSLHLLTGNAATSLSRIGKGASALANMGIVFVVMIAGASQLGRDLRQFVNNVRILLRPATIGAVGVLLGSTFAAYMLRLTLLNSAAHNEVWASVWQGAVANANGWIGDSTTFYPTLSIIEQMSKYPISSAQFKPAAILLDTICGLLWLGLAMHMASKHRVGGSKPIPVTPQSTQNTERENRKSAIGMTLFCLVGVVAAICVLTLGEVPSLKKSGWHPPLAICIYLLAFITGYMLARLDSRVASPVARKRLLLFAIGLIGMNSGLTTDAKAAPLTLMYLSIIAIGAFAGHILMLRLFGGKDWGLLFVASMCSIGGLATAPMVAQQYSEDLVEPSYAGALWCNLISLSCVLMGWVLSAA